MSKTDNEHISGGREILRTTISKLIDYIRGYKDKYRAETATKLSALQAELRNTDKQEKQKKQVTDEELNNLWSDIAKQVDDQKNLILEKEQYIDYQEREILSRDQLIVEKDREIQARDQQILRLQDDLNRIHSSMTWRTARKLHRVVDGILPLGTKRRFLVKRLAMNLMHPAQLIRNLSPLKLITYFRYLNKIGPTSLENVVNPVLHVQPNTAIPNWYMDVPDPEKLKSIDDIVEIEFTPLPAPLVSIIIPVFNQWQYTYTCLKSVAENTDGVEYEVIIGDDHSTDQTADMLKKVRNITVVTGGENQGFINNCNNAAAHARGRYLLFLNNDTYVTKGWLRALVYPLDNDEKTGIVGAKLFYKDGTLQEAGCIIWDNPVNLVTNYGRGQNPDNYEFNYLREVDYCSGCCLLVRGNIFRSAGGFNSHYLPAYAEDTDLCFTARELGYKTVYQPEAEIVHYEHVSFGRDWDSPSRRRMKINKQLFYKKWKSVIKRDHFETLKNVFLARDRSRYKKHLLMMEYQLPTWDRDAGSLTIYSYLKLLAGLGFRITFIPHNLTKMMPYTLELQRMGIEVVYGYFDFDNWIQANGKYIDVAWLARPETSIAFIDKIRQFSKADILYYVHDLHYLRERRRYEVEKDERVMAESERYRQMEYSIFGKSDVIMTPSKIEADILRKELPDKRIEVIPAYIYEDDVAIEQPPAFQERRDIIFLGGFLHTPNIDAVLWFAKEVFPLVLKKLPDLKLTIIGHSPSGSVKALACENITVTGHVRELKPWFDKAKVFVAPLRYGAGLKGKIVTSMYYGLPVVTTSIGNEGLDLRDGEQAMIADAPEELAEKIVRLYTDEKLWQSMSHKGMELVRDRFSQKSAREKILGIVNLHLCSKCNKLFVSSDRGVEYSSRSPELCSNCRASVQ